jgi:murein DD-endopeptidase MepM/ murein hydrolase activator NlpD
MAHFCEHLLAKVSRARKEATMTAKLHLRRAVALPALLGAMMTTMTVAVPSASAQTPAAPEATTFTIAKRVVLTSRAALPVSNYHLTGRFGDVSGLWSTVHTGLDFATSYGTPIHSIANGVVVEAGYDGAYGNKTVVRLKDGTELWFCHQASIAVSVGQKLNAGVVLGYVGATGNVTGPHLHLEVHPHGGAPVDPYAWLVARSLRP